MKSCKIISICNVKRGLYIRPYCDGDEKDEKVSVVTMDARTRLSIPHHLRNQAKLKGYTYIEIEPGGVLRLFPMSEPQK